MGILRRALDALYLAGGVVAALFTLAILVIIVAQMIARWTGNVFPGATDYAGYCMAAASFFAFAYALNHGAHIRVSLLLNALGRHRVKGELWCFGMGAVISSYFAWYGVRGMFESLKWNDISQGLDKTPIWIPQISMAVGTVLLAIAFWDNLARLIMTGHHGMRSGAIETGTE
ncbi:TRAP transporter small permease [Aquicoccus porphyridii]|uniref:TRAP transporter small permease protein n=1 Tax=Aquicoccus porphyridii TaxID=1852029 RepID=A0A5A9ZGE6_9RHOB|nr:TRAP transporter small permease subunit [Aquicoccus porphyridii]KAA0916323.1 TRAP transporter small permease [Aquicoccus porphyridii]RAI53551.1 TRAP transporter small permease [Rhodobacteraceae bacterium AsT-22]